MNAPRKMIGHPQPRNEDKRFVAKKLGFTETEFEAILALPNRRHEEFATDAVVRRRYFRLLAATRPMRSMMKRLSLTG